MTGVELIAAERKRQIEVEGHTSENDQQWSRGQMAMAAACYAMIPPARDGMELPGEVSKLREMWPSNWPMRWWKPTPDNRIRELEKAGALIAAEIDRLRIALAREAHVKVLGPGRLICKLCGQIGNSDAEIQHLPDCILAKPRPGDGLRERMRKMEEALELVLSNESDPKTAAEFDGYTLDDDTREAVKAALVSPGGGDKQ